MSHLPPATVATSSADPILDVVQDALDDPAAVGPVVVVLRGVPRAVASLAGAVADGLARPLHRLATADLVGDEADRARALLALLDTAVTTGAVVMVDGADTFVSDPARAGAIRTRVDELDGTLVMMAVEHDGERAAALAGTPLLVVEVLASGDD